MSPRIPVSSGSFSENESVWLSAIEVFSSMPPQLTLRKMRCIASTLVLSLILQGSCMLMQKRVEPSYPTNVSGWQAYVRQGVKFRGSFVLKKNETTSDGNIQIKLTDVSPPDSMAEPGSHNSRPRAHLQFTRVADQNVICEGTYAEDEGRTLAADCGDTIESLGIIGIGIRAINLKEKWVFFELTGYGIHEK